MYIIVSTRGREQKKKKNRKEKNSSRRVSYIIIKRGKNTRIVCRIDSDVNLTARHATGELRLKSLVSGSQFCGSESRLVSRTRKTNGNLYDARFHFRSFVLSRCILIDTRRIYIE